MKRKQAGINAAAWFYGTSFHGGGLTVEPVQHAQPKQQATLDGGTWAERAVRDERSLAQSVADNNVELIAWYAADLHWARMYAQEDAQENAQ